MEMMTTSCLLLNAFFSIESDENLASFSAWITSSNMKREKNHSLAMMVVEK